MSVVTITIALVAKEVFARSFGAVSVDIILLVKVLARGKKRYTLFMSVWMASSSITTIHLNASLSTKTHTCSMVARVELRSKISVLKRV